MDNKVIFWDMDKTLGFFEQLYYGNLANIVPECITNPFGLKEGIEDLLNQTASAGLTHYVTTSAKRDYAIKVLKNTDIEKYFRKVFTRKELCGVLGIGHKNYAIPIEDIGLSLENAKSDVLIIGNSTNDVPNKDYGIVSIIDKHQWMRNSELTKKMIHLLIDNGNGDFNKGFNELYANSEKISQRNGHLSNIGKISIEGDAELHLAFIEKEGNRSQSPIFFVAQADKYYRKNVNE